jgi:CII-binding regulator of phage lambda lysogenization HflD
MLFPWGKYKYKRLPMGIKIVPDVFQNVMSALTQDMEYVKTYLDDMLKQTNKSFNDYLDDLLILSSKSFSDHQTKLEMVLARLSTVGRRVNASK